MLRLVTLPGGVLSVKFCFLLLIPAEGGEGYPMKLLLKNSPIWGAGLIIALIAGPTLPHVIRSVIAPLDLLPGTSPDLLTASLGLSMVVTMLAWHHLFDDYPSAQLVPNQAARVLIRFAIWVLLGLALGVLWIKFLGDCLLG